MKINWKVRIKNPVFWLQVGVAVLTPILAYLGINASDITSWSKVWTLVVDAITNPYLLVLVVTSVFNSINDPTTKGICDGQHAKTYTRPG